MPHRLQIRQAGTDDVAAIAGLLAPFAEKHVLLPRPQDDIFQHLQEFLVAEYDGEVVGASALHIYTSKLAEIRSLVVGRAHQGMGAGRLLVEACEKWGAGLGVVNIFALTYVPDFFAGMGYERVPKESLPHKIWTVCIHCAKFADCDEIAVQKKLSDAEVEPVPVVPILEMKSE